MKLNLVLSLSILGALPAAAGPLYLLPGAHFDREVYRDLWPLFGGDVYVPNMPNRTRHPTPAYYRERTLRVYAESTCRSLRPAATLVAHSQAGAVANQMLGTCPEKIKAIVYVAAPVPYPGEKPFDLFSAKDDEWYQRGATSTGPGGLFVIKDPRAFVEGFLQDGTATQKARIAGVAKEEPVAPSESVLRFDLRRLLRIPKLVVVTTRDRIVTRETQLKYFRRLVNAEKVELPSGHLPMVTRPKELARAIVGFLVRKGLAERGAELGDLQQLPEL